MAALYLPCSSYLRQQSLGLRLLLNLPQHLIPSETDVSVAFPTDFRYLLKTILIQRSRLSVHFQLDENGFQIKKAIAALAWLCSAVRVPSKEHNFIYSSSTYRWSRYCERKKNSSGNEVQQFRLIMQHNLHSSRITGFKDSCWRPLLECGVIADTQFSEPREEYRGLELSFDLMIAMAAVELSVPVKDGIALIGYQTALVPIEVGTDCVQFHLEVNQANQINPHELEHVPAVGFRDCNEFRNKRCFIGWCEDARIQLGTKQLTARVRYSGKREQRTRLHWEGISTLIQANSVAPMQAGVAIQSNFRFVSNRLSFPASELYAKMLRDTSKELAIIFDVEARRCWMVPKLSLLLHMSHAWVLHAEMAADLIPFADPHHDAQELVTLLDGSGDLMVCGNIGEPFKLRSLLLGLNINLMESIKLSGACRSRFGNGLSAFEFMDIVREPGRGAYVKKVPIKTEGKNWLKILNDVDAVVVCSGIGEVISPADSINRRCDKCNSLPGGLDYLAAPISCLKELVERNGGILEDLIPTAQIELPNENIWAICGNPFRKCPHDQNSTTTCWEVTGVLQQIMSKGWIRSNCTAAAPSTPPLLGAVVFGKAVRRKWEWCVCTLSHLGS